MYITRLGSKKFDYKYFVSYIIIEEHLNQMLPTTRNRLQVI